MRPIHRPGRRPFEVDPFAVIPAAVTRTLELVFAGLPVWRAAQVSAARVDYEYAIRRAIYPDAKFLLEFGIDAKRKLRWIANLENRIRLKKGARKKETEECQKPRRQEACHHRPDK